MVVFQETENCFFKFRIQESILESCQEEGITQKRFLVRVVVVRVMTTVFSDYKQLIYFQNITIDSPLEYSNLLADSTKTGPSEMPHLFSVCVRGQR